MLFAKNRPKTSATASASKFLSGSAKENGTPSPFCRLPKLEATRRNALSISRIHPTPFYSLVAGIRAAMRSGLPPPMLPRRRLAGHEVVDGFHEGVRALMKVPSSTALLLPMDTATARCMVVKVGLASQAGWAGGCVHDAHHAFDDVVK